MITEAQQRDMRISNMLTQRLIAQRDMWHPSSRSSGLLLLFHPQQSSPYLVHETIEGLSCIRAATIAVLFTSQHEGATGLQRARLGRGDLHHSLSTHRRLQHSYGKFLNPGWPQPILSPTGQANISTVDIQRHWW